MEACHHRAVLVAEYDEEDLERGSGSWKMH